MRRSTPLLAALLLAAGARPARAMPEVMAEIGRSFAVSTPVSGAFDQGGFSTALSVLWPVEDYLRIGVAFFADDMGSLVVELTDKSQHPPASLGVFNLAHVNTYGGAWRMDVIGPRIRRLDTFVSGDWGIYRLRADRYGAYLSDATKTGWSLAGGLMAPIREDHAVGITIGYNRVFSNLTKDYMSARLAWHWRPGVHPRAAGSKH